MKPPKNRVLLTFAFILVLSSAPSWARADEPRSGIAIWGGAAAGVAHHDETNDHGTLVVAGIGLPAVPTDRRSIRFSVSRLFDGSPIARYNLLCHFGYRITDRLGAGLLGGVEYLDVKNSPDAYLKPLIGAEVDFVLAATASSVLSLFTAYESAQGSTGTLALNGGSAAESAGIISLGLVVSFATLP
jgi:hypothetical protein